MPSSKFGSKFFGERYQQYVDELTAEGTIDGEKLSPTERKEGFKKYIGLVRQSRLYFPIRSGTETEPITVKNVGYTKTEGTPPPPPLY